MPVACASSLLLVDPEGGLPPVTYFITSRFAGGSEARAFHAILSCFPLRGGRIAQGTASAQLGLDEPLLVPASWAGREEGVPSVSVWVGSGARPLSPLLGALLVFVGVGIPLFSFLPGGLTPAGSLTARVVSSLIAVGLGIFSLSKNVSSLFEAPSGGWIVSSLCPSSGLSALFSPCFPGEGSFLKLKLSDLLCERSESKMSRRAGPAYLNPGHTGSPL